ncbi:hypothetical protein BC940DRAFT_246446 [Gongronella butleri]|nr:hypothetical protein BC940DRAFT_246446 [Gongronella butleri]
MDHVQSQGPVAAPLAKPVKTTPSASEEVLVLGNQLPGGLLTRNKSSKDDADRPVFKAPAPKSSLLGLDTLARRKREAAEAKGSSTDKKIKVAATDNWDDDNVSSNDNESLPTRHGKYRQHRMETPSHPGGVSDQALRRIEDRRRRERDRSQRKKKRERKKKPMGHHDDDRRGRRDRDDDRRRRDDDRRRTSDRDRRESDRRSSGRTPGLSPSASPSPRRGGLIKRDQWGEMTPSRSREPFTPSSFSSRSSYPEEYPGDEEERMRWEQEQAQLDREWYGMEESGTMDETHNPFSDFETAYDQKKEEEMAQRQLKKLSARQAQYNKDADMWEASRMLSSGVAQRRELDTDFDDDAENRVHLLVHDIKPPFLDGRMVYTKQMEAVQHVRDPTSDLAIMSRKGSRLVREKREQAERQKAAKFDLAGTTLGNVMGVQSKEAEEEAEAPADEKNESKFAEHMKSSQAVSDFARTRSMREQREYLPVFAVREELLKVVRDNQGKKESRKKQKGRETSLLTRRFFLLQS